MAATVHCDDPASNEVLQKIRTFFDAVGPLQKLSGIAFTHHVSM